MGAISVKVRPFLRHAVASISGDRVPISLAISIFRTTPGFPTEALTSSIVKTRVLDPSKKRNSQMTTPSS
jgi:hypothetical protein